MIRYFRQKYTKAGKRGESKKLYFAVSVRGVEQRFPGYEERKPRLTAALARNVERLVQCRESGESLPADLAQWLTTIPDKLRGRLTKLGLLSAKAAAGSTALEKLVDDFEVAHREKATTEKQTRGVVGKIRRLIRECGFSLWSHVDADAVSRKLSQWREAGMSRQTSNNYLAAIKQFCRWMTDSGRADRFPLTRLRKLNAQADRKHPRRALTADEVRRLLAAAEAGKRRFHVAGPERALLYRLAVESGLRASELRSLTKSSFHLTARPPYVLVRAAHSKTRREDSVELKAATVVLLEKHLKGKTAAARAFAVPRPENVARMLRGDLEAAGIPYRTEDGYADFHALRHTCGSLLLQAGVYPKVVQRHMRHSSITLTMDLYGHLTRHSVTEAIEKFPDFDAAEKPEAGKKTGKGAG